MPQNLGMSAKIEPEADRSSTRKMKRDLEKELEDVEQMEFQGSGGDFQSRTTPSAGGRGGGAGGGLGGSAMAFGAGRKMKGGAAAGAGKSASRGLAGIGGSAALAGAGVAATVALGGILAKKMYDAMERASGTLQAANSIWGQAMKLFWKPFGDALGKWLLPYAKEALDMATTFNKIADEQGLTVAIGWLAGSVMDKLAGALSLDGGFDIPSPGDLWQGIKNFDWADWMVKLQWLNWLNPLSWPSFLVQLYWDDFVMAMDWDSFVALLQWGDFLTPLTDWSPFIDYLSNDGIRKAIFKYVDIKTSQVLDWLFGGFSIGKSDVLDILFGETASAETGGGGGSRTVREVSKGERARMDARGTQRVTVTSDAGGTTQSLDSGGTVNVQAEVDGKRLFEGVSKQEEDLLRRL